MWERRSVVMPNVTPPSVSNKTPESEDVVVTLDRVKEKEREKGGASASASCS